MAPAGQGGGGLAAIPRRKGQGCRSTHAHDTRTENFFNFFLRIYFVDATKKIKKIEPLDEFSRRRYAENAPDGAGPAGPANRRRPAASTKGEVNMDEMTTREVDRLADWLKAQGFTAEQVLECIKYITGTTPPPEK